MPENTPEKSLHPVIKLAYAIEDYAIVSVLLTMIILSVVQIVMRNAFGRSLIWADPVLRISIVWIGLLGAMIATRNNDHISIDLLSLYLSKKSKRYLSAFLSLFSAIICGIVCYHSYRFVFDEYQYKSIAFGSMPSWIFQSIIPVAFFIITFRYIALFILALLDKMPENSSEEEEN